MIALATCAQFPALDTDDALLRAALGADSVPVVWDDPGVDWDDFALVVVRSTWDYTDRREEFLSWCDHIGERLLNPPPVIRWNSDKRYLADLTAAGLYVVPTAFYEPGGEIGPLEVPCVVKPTVSAGSRDTARHEDAAAAAAHAGQLLDAGRVAMVQPYVADVDVAGETALLYYDGAYDHAIRKAPLLTEGVAAVDGLFAPENIEAREPRTIERAVADAVVEYVERRFGRLLYVRVDLIGEEPAVLELELTEPSLFFGHADGAAERYADAIRRRAPGPVSA